MGRTLHYRVFGKMRDYVQAEKEIQIAQELMIYRFTWPVECPSLRSLDWREQLRYSDESVLRPRARVPVAEGFTKVRDDEWNAVLVTRFITWVSRRLPDTTVTLYDEGDYLTAGYHLFRNGVPMLDRDKLADHARYLAESHLNECLFMQEAAILEFERGVIHRDVPAQEYADRQEFRALGLTPDVFARMTLDEVADLITFPWTTEGLGAA